MITNYDMERAKKLGLQLFYLPGMIACAWSEETLSMYTFCTTNDINQFLYSVEED